MLPFFSPWYWCFPILIFNAFIDNYKSDIPIRTRQSVWLELPSRLPVRCSVSLGHGPSLVSKSPAFLRESRTDTGNSDNNSHRWNEEIVVRKTSPRLHQHTASVSTWQLQLFTSLKWTSCIPTSSIMAASSSMFGVMTRKAEQPCLNIPSHTYRWEKEAGSECLWGNGGSSTVCRCWGDLSRHVCLNATSASLSPPGLDNKLIKIQWHWSSRPWIQSLPGVIWGDIALGVLSKTLLSLSIVDLGARAVVEG